mmetsp:Transcript_31742/g.84729  ORF Transcript_31742/g.84729 Transcript_31742/m.84729 type:complete len:238 (+) Transcript_31742:994-1707(+)
MSYLPVVSGLIAELITGKARAMLQNATATNTNTWTPDKPHGHTLVSASRETSRRLVQGSSTVALSWVVRFAFPRGFAATCFFALAFGVLVFAGLSTVSTSASSEVGSFFVTWSSKWSEKNGRENCGHQVVLVSCTLCSLSGSLVACTARIGNESCGHPAFRESCTLCSVSGSCSTSMVASILACTPNAAVAFFRLSTTSWQHGFCISSDITSHLMPSTMTSSLESPVAMGIFSGTVL